MNVKGFLQILTGSHPHENRMREPLQDEVKEGAVDSEKKRLFYERIAEGNAMIEAEKSAHNLFGPQP